MKPSRKKSKNLYVVNNPLTSYDYTCPNNNITILPTSVEPSSLYLYDSATDRGVTRSRRNTFTYGQSKERSSQFLTPPLPSLSMDSQLVPYSKEWTVILRNETAGQLVLYNTFNRRVSVRRLLPNNDSQPQALTTPHMCTLCGRPYELTNNMSGSSSSDFMHRNYFQLLENFESTQPETSPTIKQSHSFTESSTATTSTGFYEEVHANLSQSSFNQGYYGRFFIEEKKLGRGFRGSVYLCKHVLDNVHLGEYAIKKVAVGDNHAWLVRMLREVHLLEKLHHPNIVDYKHAWLEHHQLTNFGPQVPCLFILMECANGGNLEEYINERLSTFVMQQDPEVNLSTKERVLRARRMKRSQEQSPTIDTHVPSRRYLELREIWSLFINICEGLAHLHRHGIVHRDLKPPNLLLHYDEGSTGMPRVLISDFGECEILDQLTERERTGATGTLEFMAPELLTVDERGKYHKDYSSKSDMWSLGMVLYYLCYSRLPYRQVDDVDLLKDEILHFDGVSSPENANFFPSLSRKIPQRLKDLIKRLLSKQKKNRPSCDDILKSIGDIQTTFTSNVYSETSGESSFNPPITPITSNPIVSGLQREDMFDLSSEPDSFVLSNHSTTSTKISTLSGSSESVEDYQPSQTANLRRRSIVEKVQVFRDTITEGPSRSSIGRDSVDINGSVKDNQTAIVRVTPLRNSLYQITCYLGLIFSYKFEGGWCKLFKFIIVIFKIASCMKHCSPYLPSSLMLYPVIVFAIMDLYTKRISISILLGLIHIIWIITFNDSCFIG